MGVFKGLKRLFVVKKSGRMAAGKPPEHAEVGELVRELQKKLMDSARENQRPRTGA